MNTIIKKRNPVVAFLLSYCPGLGQLYNGQFKKGVLYCLALQILVIFIVFISLLIISSNSSVGQLIIVPTIAALALPYVLIAIESVATSIKINRTSQLIIPNRWYMYLAYFACVVSFNLLLAQCVKHSLFSAYKIPTGAMENSILVGDFVLGNMQAYSKDHQPKQDDIMVFEYPGNDFEIGNVQYSPKKFIKRYIAGPGQVVELEAMRTYVDGKEIGLPSGGQYILNGILSDSVITKFVPLRIPKKGDVISVDSLPIREFFFLRNLIEQENSGSRFTKFLEGQKHREHTNLDLTKSFPNVTMGFSLFIDGRKSDSTEVYVSRGRQTQALTFDSFAKQLNLLMCCYNSWSLLNSQLEGVMTQLKERYPGKNINIRKELYLRGKRLTSYTVRNDCYFVLGDNRDNSADSRYWGYVDKNYVKAKACLIYYSVDNNLRKVRWNRIGKIL